MYRFRLYVAGSAPNSSQAIANLSTLCRKVLPGRHEIEVVDVFRHPGRALADRILMTPTLVRLAPLPVVRVVGSLSQTQTVLLALGLGETPEPVANGNLRPASKSRSPRRSARS